MSKDYRNNIEPAANVCAVRLKKWQYKSGKGKAGKWEAVEVAFNKSKQWLNAMIFNPSVSRYKNNDRYKSMKEAKEAWDKERRRIKFQIDSIGIAIIGKEAMADIQNDTKGQPFRAYIDAMLDEFEKNDFKSKKLCIKTFPNKEGDVEIPRFGDFVRAEDSDREEFSYTDWEQDRFDENVEKTKYAKYGATKSKKKQQTEDLIGDGPGWSDGWDDDEEKEEVQEDQPTNDDEPDWDDAVDDGEEEEDWENDLPF